MEDREKRRFSGEAPLRENAEMFFDEEGLLERVGGSRKMVRILLEEFLQEMSCWMEELQRAAEEKSFEALREEAHKIKGAAGNMGALGIGEVAKALENEGVRKNGEELERLLGELKTQLETLRRYREKWDQTEEFSGREE